MRQSGLICSQESEYTPLLIKVESIPPVIDGIPPWVMQEFKGLKFPLPHDHPPWADNSVFLVDFPTVIRVLKKQNPEAAVWLKENPPPLHKGHLGFKAEAENVSLWGPYGKIDFTRNHPDFRRS